MLSSQKRGGTPYGRTQQSADRHGEKKPFGMEPSWAPISICTERPRGNFGGVLGEFCDGNTQSIQNPLPKEVAMFSLPVKRSMALSGGFLLVPETKSKCGFPSPPAGLTASFCRRWLGFGLFSFRGGQALPDTNFCVFPFRDVRLPIETLDWLPLALLSPILGLCYMESTGNPANSTCTFTGHGNIGVSPWFPRKTI